jgi:hypothetical protein
MTFERHDMTVCIADGGLWINANDIADRTRTTQEAAYEWMAENLGAHQEHLLSTINDVLCDAIAALYRDDTEPTQTANRSCDKTRDALL